MSAYASLSKKQRPNAPLALSAESLTAEAQILLPPSTTLPEEFEYAVGEVYVYILNYIFLLRPLFTEGLYLPLKRSCSQRGSTQYGCFPWRSRGSGNHQDDHSPVYPYQRILCYRLG